MNILKFEQPASTIVRNINWHNKRYSEAEIRKIQAALVKEGFLPEVTGKVDRATIEAITKFQQNFRNGTKANIKVDGLAGDETLSALMVHLGAGNALNSTRKGTNQARQQVEETEEDKRMREYFNSPEMIQYLTNVSNAYGPQSLQYEDLVYKSLKYLSPEAKSRVMRVNDIPMDEYDENISAIHNAAVKRQQGMKNMPSAIASGNIQSGSNYGAYLDNFASTYGLSAEDTEKVLNSESGQKGSEKGLELQETGKHNSDEKQAKEMKKAVSAAESNAGVTMMKTVLNPMAPVYGAITWNGTAPYTQHMAGTSTELSDALGVDRSEHPVGSFALDIIGNPWSASGIASIMDLTKDGIKAGKTAAKNYAIREREAIKYANNTPKGPRSKGVTVKSTTSPAPAQTTTSTLSVDSAAPRTTQHIKVDGQVLNESSSLAEGAGKNARLRKHQWKYGNQPYNKSRWKVGRHYEDAKTVYEPSEVAEMKRNIQVHPTWEDRMVLLESPASKMKEASAYIPGMGSVVAAASTLLPDNFAIQGSGYSKLPAVSYNYLDY